MKPIATAGLVLIKDKKILLTKRNTEPFFGYWSIPGGKIEFGETVIETLNREIKEEINVSIENIKFIEYVDEIFPDINIHYIGHLFTADIIGEIQIDNVELVGFGWYTKEEVMNMEIGFGHKDTLVKYLIEEESDK